MSVACGRTSIFRAVCAHATYELDPLLPLVEGSQQTPANRAIFGAFSDAAPGRWGRRLIGRSERRRVEARDRVAAA
jgi:serine/threonine-protein kinase HipA